VAATCAFVLNSPTDGERSVLADYGQSARRDGVVAARRVGQYTTVLRRSDAMVYFTLMRMTPRCKPLDQRLAQAASRRTTPHWMS
jgi:hypothetical protein